MAIWVISGESPGVHILHYEAYRTQISAASA
jgi:hypothetical protein